MKSADPEQQFLTVMKNGKFGVFRAEMDFQKIAERFSESEKLIRPEEGERAVYVDGFDIFFATIELAGLSGVEARFPSQGQGQEALNRKLAHLDWLDWLANQIFNDLENILRAGNLSFRLLTYTDNSLGLLVTKGNSSVLILFDETGVITSIGNHFDFSETYRLLKELKSHNL